jgi:hypothetical protein
MKNETSDKKKTEIAVPSAFMEDAGSGLENVGAEDVTIPRLKLLQAMSPEVNKHDGKYISGATTGDIINTVNNTLYNDDNPLVVLPVAYKRLFLEWTPRESGGGLVAQHDDPAILEKTTKNEQYQDVLENGNYIQTSATHFVLVINKDGSYDTAMISMAGTQLKRSRTWNSMMASVKMKSGDKVFTPPSFSHKYALSCVQESNDRGTWFGWGISAKGQVTGDEMTYYEAAKTFAEQVGGINLNQTSANTDTGDAPF